MGTPPESISDHSSKRSYGSRRSSDKSRGLPGSLSGSLESSLHSGKFSSQHISEERVFSRSVASSATSRGSHIEEKLKSSKETVLLDRVGDSMENVSYDMKEGSQTKINRTSDTLTNSVENASSKMQETLQKIKRRTSKDISSASRKPRMKAKERTPSRSQSYISSASGNFPSPGLTSDDMRTKLFSSFKSRGLLENVKSQLRSGLTTAIKDSICLSETKKPKEVSLISNIADCLIAEHLKQAEYEYSLSVFQAESLAAKTHLNLQEILQFLKINPKSHVYQQIISLKGQGTSKGFLWNFLSVMLSAFDVDKSSANTQTEDCISSLLSNNIEQKMMEVDEEIRNKAMREDVTDSSLLEGRLIKFQRKLEIEKKAQLADDLKVFKETELVHMQLIEREEFRKEIERVKAEMDRKHRETLDKLKEREKESAQLIKMRHGSLDQEAFSNRQKMLLNIEALKQREHEMKRSHQMSLKSVGVEEDRLRQLAEQVKAKELTLKATEERYEMKLKEEILRMKLENQEKEQKKEEFFRMQERTLLDEKRAFEYQKSSLINLSDDHERLTAEKSQLQASLTAALRRVEDVARKAENANEKLSQMSDYNYIKQKSVILEKELALLREKFKDLQNEKESITRKHDKNMKELVEKLRNNASEKKRSSHKLSDSDRQKFLEQETHLRDRCNILENKLRNEIMKNQELNEICKEKILQQKEMFREMEELKRVPQRTNIPLSIPIHRERQFIVKDSIAEGTLRQNRISMREEAANVALTRNSAKIEAYSELYNPTPHNNLPGTAFVRETKDVFEKLEKEAAELEKSYQTYQHKIRSQETMLINKPNTIDYTGLMHYNSALHPPSSNFLVGEKMKKNNSTSTLAVGNSYFRTSYPDIANEGSYSTDVYKLNQFGAGERQSTMRKEEVPISGKHLSDTWSGDHLTEQLLSSAINDKDEEGSHKSLQNRDSAVIRIASKTNFQTLESINEAANMHLGDNSKKVSVQFDPQHDTTNIRPSLSLNELEEENRAGNFSGGGIEAIPSDIFTVQRNPAFQSQLDRSGQLGSENDVAKVPSSYDRKENGETYAGYSAGGGTVASPLHSFPVEQSVFQSEQLERAVSGRGFDRDIQRASFSDTPDANQQNSPTTFQPNEQFENFNKEDTSFIDNIVHRQQSTKDQVSAAQEEQLETVAKQENERVQQIEEQNRREHEEKRLALERERRELERFEREELAAEDTNSSADSKNYSQRSAAAEDVPRSLEDVPRSLEDVSKPASEVIDDGEPKVDPLMQHYMQLLLKKKEEEQEKVEEEERNKEDEAQDLNLTDDFKLETKLSYNSDVSELLEHDIEDVAKDSDDDFVW